MTNEVHKQNFCYWTDLKPFLRATVHMELKCTALFNLLWIIWILLLLAVVFAARGQQSVPQLVQWLITFVS